MLIEGLMTLEDITNLHNGGWWSLRKAELLLKRPLCEVKVGLGQTVVGHHLVELMSKKEVRLGATVGPTSSHRDMYAVAPHNAL